MAILGITKAFKGTLEHGRFAYSNSPCRLGKMMTAIPAYGVPQNSRTLKNTQRLDVYFAESHLLCDLPRDHLLILAHPRVGDGAPSPGFRTLQPGCNSKTTGYQNMIAERTHRTRLTRHVRAQQQRPKTGTGNCFLRMQRRVVVRNSTVPRTRLARLHPRLLRNTVQAASCSRDASERAATTTNPAPCGEVYAPGDSQARARIPRAASPAAWTRARPSPPSSDTHNANHPAERSSPTETWKQISEEVIHPPAMMV